MKKLFVSFVLLIALLQSGFCQIIPIDSCIVWQKETCDANRIDVSPDSKYIATACSDGFIKIYNLEDGSLLNEFRASDSYVYSIKYSSDGHYLISIGYEGIVKIWDSMKWDTIKTIIVGKPDGYHYYATISHNNRYIAATRALDGVSIYDLISGQLLKTYKLLESTEWNEMPIAQSVEFSPDDYYIAVAADYNPGRLINIQTDSTIITDSLNYAGRTFYATFSNDGKSFITGYGDTDNKHFGVNSYNIQSKELYKTFTSYGSIFDIAVSPNDNYLSVGTYSNELVDIWNFKTGNLFETSKINGEFVKFTPDSNFFVIQGLGKSTLVDFYKLTPVKEIVSIKEKNQILNVYPNPSKSIFLIDFYINNFQKIKISIVDIKGNEVEILSNNNWEKGEHQINWDISQIVNGIYFIKLVSGNSVDVKKIIVSK